jgi:aminopeptidase N
MTAPQPILLQDYRPPAYLIDTVDLRFDLRSDGTTVTARLAMRRNPASGTEPAPLALNGEGLETRSVAIDGAVLPPDAYTVANERMTIARVPSSFVLETVVWIEPHKNTALSGLYVSSGNWCTQCEAEGFRRITWYLDRPDVMARFTTTIEGDREACPVLLSNGNLAASGDAGNGRHWARWEDPFPKPAYLFALVAGKLAAVRDTYVTGSGRTVALNIYVEPGNEDRCGHAMDSLKKSMAWDEKVYGLEYDLDIFNIVAVSDFNMGAMENKSLNVFNSKYILASRETATDGDFLGIESVVAHEYFHNWTGNRVTCRDWFQLSLKEGLTVFRDQQFSADMNSAAVKRIGDVQVLRSAQFQEDASAMAHPVRPDKYVEINNFYTPTVYNKGAEVIRMMHTLLGAEGYRKGIDLYFQRHDGQAVTCDDFAQAMADAGGVDLTQFKLWYSQAGTPSLDVTGAHDPASRTFRLTVKQTVPPTPGQPGKKPMHIPLAVGLLGPDGAELPLALQGSNVPEASRPKTLVLNVTAPEQTFTFVDVSDRPVPSLLRGFSAPVKLSSDLTEADLLFLMAHDTDGFTRWEAGQTLGTRLLLGLIADVQAGRDLAVPAAFVDAAAAVLADADRDPAFAAQALLLPTGAYLVTQMAVADPIAIHTARKFVVRTLGERLREEWLATYRRLAGGDSDAIDAAAIGRRSLKNMSLGYLTATDDAEAAALAAAQFRNAASMTDAMAALYCLTDSESPEREAVLEAFRAKWAGDKLVMDKWFAVQAVSARADTLDRVKALLGHPQFDLRNPNKIYSLIGSFAGGNLLRFHAPDGSGYAFLADMVLRIDPMNPQVAARLMGQFSRIKRFDARRQAQMRDQLVRIIETKPLSTDVLEIASRCLETVAATE